MNMLIAQEFYLSATYFAPSSFLLINSIDESLILSRQRSPVDKAIAMQVASQGFQDNEVTRDMT